MTQESNIPNRRPRPMTWQERLLRNSGVSLNMPYAWHMTIPKWLVTNPIVFFFIAMVACWVAFGHVPGMHLVLTACISVVLFFTAGYIMANNWKRVSEKRFLKNVFIAGFLIRVLWVLYMFFIFNPEFYGNTYGSTADTDWFMAFGRGLADWIRGDIHYSLSQVIDINMSAIDDVAYPMWLAVVYVLTGEMSDVFIPMVVKCIVGAYCAISIYRVAKRHFGMGTARLAAIFVCLNPNMIYWCAAMMKEAEMVFFCCLAVDKLDEALSSGQKLTLRALWPGLLAGVVLFFMRTALGLALFLGVFAHIVFASRRVISLGKKILMGLLVVMTLAIGVGDRILYQSRSYLETVQSDAQQENMEFRSKHSGNEFVKYAGAAVFAPLIFTLPFPTLNVADVNQLVQVQLAGGSYIRNILSFFTVLVLLLLWVSGEWRKHVFIIAYTCAYLGVLVFSGYAQSGRFHMPIWPMLMLLAAYGVQLTKGNAQLQRAFGYVLWIEIGVCLVWNWFKLAGRGML